MGARGSHSRANRRAKSWKDIQGELTVAQQMRILRGDIRKRETA